MGLIFHYNNILFPGYIVAIFLHVIKRLYIISNSQDICALDKQDKSSSLFSINLILKFDKKD